MTDATFVVIAARAYSGSTLLASMLGAHPSIATVSELSGRRRENQMDVFRCSCGRVMQECPFWQAVLAEMQRRGYPDFRLANFQLSFSRSSEGRPERLLRGSLRWSALEEARDRLLSAVPGHAEGMLELGRRNRSFAETILSLTGARVFVDASKERMRVRNIARYVNMDLKVIHLVRDVRGVVDSMARHAGRRVDVALAARDWASTNRTLLRHVGRVPPDRRFLLRYEDLCNAPQATLRALHEFCGVDPRTPGAEGEREQHLLGNARRPPRDWSTIRLDERWRSNLGAEDQAQIANASGAIGLRLYPELVAAAGVRGRASRESAD